MYGHHKHGNIAPGGYCEASFVDAVKLLGEGVSSKFKSPVYVALMPCQDSDLNEAEEMHLQRNWG